MRSSSEPRKMIPTADAYNLYHAVISHGLQVPNCAVAPDILYGKPRPDEMHIVTPRGEHGRLRVWELDPDNKLSTVEWDCLDDGGGWVDLTMMSPNEAIRAVFDIPSCDLPTIETKERLEVPKF